MRVVNQHIWPERSSREMRRTQYKFIIAISVQANLKLLFGQLNLQRAIDFRVVVLGQDTSSKQKIRKQFHLSIEIHCHMIQ